MNSRKVVVGVIIALALVLGAATFVLAQAGPRQGGRGPGQGQGQARMGNPPILGEIISIEGSTWTVKPQRPEFMEGRERPEGQARELPDQVTFKVNADTKYFFDNAEADKGKFSIGDMVVAVVRGKPDALVASHIADPQTAREYLRDRIMEFRDQRMEEGRGRPAFGTITALSTDSITLKPEIPQFVRDMMEKNGRELPDVELPDEITISLGDRTRYLVDGERVEKNPFKLGDKVAVMGGRGDIPAMAVADYATAQQMAKLGGPPEGQGPGRPGEGHPGGGPQGPRGPRK